EHTRVATEGKDVVTRQETGSATPSKDRRRGAGTQDPSLREPGGRSPAAREDGPQGRRHPRCRGRGQAPSGEAAGGLGGAQARDRGTRAEPARAIRRGDGGRWPPISRTGRPAGRIARGAG